MASQLLITSLLLLLMASITFGDEIQTSGSVPTAAGLLCISECGTCPVICSPPPSPPTSSESGDFPPLTPTTSPPTPTLLTPSTPLLLPPEAPIFDFSPPPSYHPNPPPTPPRTPPPTTKAPPSSTTPLVTNPKSARPPPDLPYVIVPGGPAPPLGQGNDNPYPYYYFYSNGASLSNSLPGFCFSVLLIFLIHAFCLVHEIHV